MGLVLETKREFDYETPTQFQCPLAAGPAMKIGKELLAWKGSGGPIDRGQFMVTCPASPGLVTEDGTLEESISCFPLSLKR